MSIQQTAEKAKAASKLMAAVDTNTKNDALGKIAEALEANTDAITAANKEDLERAEKGNLARALLKRLKFDGDKIAGVCRGLRSLAALEDPVGKTLASTELDSGLELYKVACPLGVVGVIFESRPDALVQISSLCLKSGNGVLLKGGSEAAKTNRILADIISRVSVEAGLPDGWIGLLETREDVSAMLGLDNCVDLIVPRGSNEFVQFIMNNTNIPVLGHADGICHVYVDRQADLDMAAEITADSKCQYPAVCNAMETLLVHTDIAEQFLPAAKKALDEYGCRLKGCEKTQKIIECEPADEDDWQTEYLDYELSIKAVSRMEDAIEHINKYGSGHTDAIVSSDEAAARKFLSLVDSADVFWNASTRFSDGFRYGLGAEVGISTNKIHARGPVGLEGLLIYKWLLLGNGQTAGEYASGQRQFTHKTLGKDCPL
ncbi:glutamate-5-semialdehyde dehydrogenase [Sedimentisphaera salicampi]|uniref:Gamma-glutamyl phosphate reductase n=1 Tax=Sedimentisphaera salicampi TaxID=1941349 RepID=A0A1W6LLS9_9BACT|nr:glutamate-5-semialdehyde dehydrogenase [Sedimentisphaera salicampi]ARN56716.1 Gamma-glutamyl phosphate reductase [Sedimentisphaera salicampi]